jgi:Spy/CpxP family protein refolding chaperone
MRELLLPLRTEMDSVRSAIAEILTPEQLAQLNETFDSMGTPRGFGGPGRGPRRRFGPPRN